MSRSQIYLTPAARKKLEKEAERRGLLRVEGPAPRFKAYQNDLLNYVRTELKIEPWAGLGEPGQLELLQDIGESIRLQLEGKPATRVFRVQAGHGIGKTFGVAAVVNFFFDCLGPSVTITTAPSKDQVNLLTWKDIKSQRKGRGLPGTVLPQESRMYRSEDWFAIGRTTSDAGGQGTSRVQGQHALYQLFVFDEAEGVPQFQYDATEAMMTGGTVMIWVLIGNPQTRSSAFHRKGREREVKNYRFSVLDFPNVVSGQALVPGGTSREWAVAKIVKHCEIVEQHDDDAFTFTVTYPVEIDDNEYPPGTIFRPDAEFCFRVLGVAPANLADRVFISPGRYEAATKRKPNPDADSEGCRIGVDCARFGSDAGAIYLEHKMVARKVAEVKQGDTDAYVEPIKKAAKEAAKAGATKLSVRVDGTGGYGAGIIDRVRADEELKELFAEVIVHEVMFGGTPHDPTAYADLCTEMYAEAAESLKGLSLIGMPNELEGDLTERTYEWVNKEGRSVRKLIDKEKFRKILKPSRSPDDGDGFVLCVAPEFIFKPGWDDDWNVY